MADDLRLADPAASYAVLAGVSKYEHLDDLPAVANNVAALRETLADPAVWGLPLDRIEIVEPEKVGSRFTWAVKEAAEKATDTLLVYYAGHGTPEDGTRELYLGLPGQMQGYVETALRYKWVAEKLNSARNTARHIIVIIDSCYSGLGTTGYMSDGETLAQVVNGEFTEIKGRAVLTSSAANKVSKAPVGAPYTAYTGELLSILESGIKDGPSLLNVETLHREIVRRLPVQLPDLGARGSTNVVCFARNAAYIPPSAGTPAPPAAERAPAPQPPATVPTLPPRMPVLVRAELEQMPRVKGFHLVRPGYAESRPVTKARQMHLLSSREELLGVWQWKRSVFESKSLVFTNEGIRVSDGGVSFQLSYADFHQSTFEYRQFAVPGVEFGTIDKTYLSVWGPDVHWSSPPMTAGYDVRHLAAALNAIRRTATGEQ
ncbi:caspase family protein [Streptomyces sp. NPDC002913]